MASVGSVSRVEAGVVVSVRPVHVQGVGTGLGASAGMLAGGLAGSRVGGGRGSGYAMFGGSILGAALGEAAEVRASSQTALQYIVQLDSGSMVSVVQSANNPIPVGRAVLVLMGRETRIIEK